MSTFDHVGADVNYEYDYLEKSMDEKCMRIIKWDNNDTDFELFGI